MQLHQTWSDMESLQGMTVKSTIFVINKNRLEMENLKKGRDIYHRQPKIRYIVLNY